MVATRYIPGGRVVLMDGTYDNAAAVNLNRQKTHVMGMGGATHVKPSGTGFTRLFTFAHMHCRVSHMLLIDSPDPHYDVGYVTEDDANQWNTVEHVHTHGSGFRFEDTVGSAVLHPEIHESSAGASANQEQVGVLFEGVQSISLFCRIEGGFVMATKRQNVRLAWAMMAHVSGLTCDRASLGNLGVYASIQLHETSESVVSALVDGGGAARWALLEGARGGGGDTNNRFFGRYRGGSTGDTSIQPTSVLYA